MSRGPDAATLLARALLASAEHAGCPVTIATADWTRWISATFAGARHMLALTVADGPVLARWLEELPEAEFALCGHLVADLVVQSVRREAGIATISLEALTVEER